MYTKQGLKFFTASIATVAICVSGMSAFAHTRLEVAEIADNTRASNNVIVGHGCGERNVIGTSVVFPDGVDSSVVVDGQPHTGTLADFVDNWGNLIKKNYSKDVFTHQQSKTDANGNVLGFWAGGGDSLPHDMNGYIPFRVGPVTLKSDSCVASVKFYVSIADICEITPTSGFNENTVNFWTHNNLCTPYDRTGTTDDGPATLTVVRDTTANPLPESCGGKGVAVEVKSSAAQINRDMPIKLDGTQIWPQ